MHNKCTLCCWPKLHLNKCCTIYYFKVQEITATLSHPFLQMMRWRNWTAKFLWRTSLIRSIIRGWEKEIYSSSVLFCFIPTPLCDCARSRRYSHSVLLMMMMMMRDLIFFIPLLCCSKAGARGVLEHTWSEKPFAIIVHRIWP